MKSFKKYISEVAEPKGAEEKRFKDQHAPEKIKHPVATDAQHTGEISKPKAKRKADQEGDADYDKAYAVKESSEMDRARYDANDDTKKKKVTLPKAPWEKKKDEELSPKQKKIDHNKNGKIDGHDLAMIRKKKNEEADSAEDFAQLDELSKKTLGSYVKKASKSAADNARAMRSADEPFHTYRATSDKYVKRIKGISKANDKLTKESVELDEISKKTLGSYINKAHKDYDKQRTKQGAAYDKAARTGRDDDEDKGHEYGRKADNRTKGIKTAVNKLTKESIEETTSSALKRAVTQTGPDGKTRTVMKKLRSDKTDDRGQDSIQTRESVELEEAVSFKKGPVRLKDGKQIMVSAQDAALLNKMFKDLSPANQKRMEKVAMMDKAGFDEIVGFAREAM